MTKTVATKLSCTQHLRNSNCVITISSNAGAQNTPTSGACKHFAFSTSVPAESAELPLAALWSFGYDSGTPMGYLQAQAAGIMLTAAASAQALNLVAAMSHRLQYI